MQFRGIKKALYQAQRGRCYYCGRAHRIDYLEVDHKWPLSRGGSNETANLQLLCTPCNMRKGIQTDREFRYRYGPLLPPDGSIPSFPRDQEDFADETQRTRASREVRSIYRNRFSRHRRSDYYRRGNGVSEFQQRAKQPDILSKIVEDSLHHALGKLRRFLRG